MTKNNVVLDYLEKLHNNEKEVFEALRNQILQLNPEIEERLSRGVPFFYYKGKRAVGFRSSKAHLSFFIMEGNVQKELKNEIAHLNVSSTVIRFNPENPIPKVLIEKLVLARLQEIEEQLSRMNF